MTLVKASRPKEEKRADEKADERASASVRLGCSYNLFRMVI